MKIFSLVAAAAIAVACLSPAAAANPSSAGRDLVQVRISTRGLDLARPADRAILDARVRRAADRACNARGAGLAAAQDAARCRSEMIGDGATRVAALLQRRNVELASVVR